jgi:hypothetical protein
MAATIKKHFADGGQGVSSPREKNGLRALFVQVLADLTAIKTKFEAHKHSFDGTAGSASAITGTPVTGATTGTAVGGTASTIALGLTKE